MKITVLKYGESVFGENYIFKGGKSDKLLPISFVIYLIQTENKNILVDVGCDDGAGFVMSQFKKPVEILREYGLSPDDVTDVIITHSHHDHIEAVGYYKNAVIHIQKDEYIAAKKYIPTTFNVHLIDNEFSVSENITVKKIGGHSVGSCIVLADKSTMGLSLSCKTAARISAMRKPCKLISSKIERHGHIYVFCGDECYYKRCLTDKICTGASCNEEASMNFIAEYAQDKYIPLLFHDPDIMTGKIGFERITNN